MRILHLAAGELSGGAAQGAYLLHKAQCEIGIRSKLLISGSGHYSDKTVVAISAGSRRKRIEFAMRSRIGNLPLYFYNRRQPWLFDTGLAGIDFTCIPDYQKADLIHLHWINGLVAIPTLRKIKKPIVWTMRDMWPLTGGCHYSIDCQRYEEGCGKCPQLRSNTSVDLSRLIVSMKRKYISAGLQPVGISRWLSDAAAASAVFSNHSIRTISNNIDTREFTAIDQATARSLLGLPDRKRILLIGAQNINDFYKGWDLWIEATRKISFSGIHLLTLGRFKNGVMNDIPVEQTHLGFLTDSFSMRLAYSAADVFVAPSRMDAFGKTLAESLACGTPVVCFDATGPKEIVDHRRTGYKARPFDAADLANGIEWVLGLSVNRFMAMRTHCRDSAVKRFDSRVIARQYLNLYNEILS